MFKSHHQIAGRAVALLTALVLVAQTHPAQAAVNEARASVSGLGFSLIDLDPLDGQNPWVRFNHNVVNGSSGFAGLNLALFIDTPSLVFGDSSTQLIATPDTQILPNGSLNLAAGSSSASIESSVDGATVQVVLNLSDTAKAVDEPYAFAAAKLDPSGYHDGGSFELSPNSLLLITGRYELTVSIASSGEVSDFGDASIQALLEPQSLTRQISHTANFYDIISLDGNDVANNFSQPGSLWGTRSDKFTLAVANSSDSSALGAFGFSLAANAGMSEASISSSVPEPGIGWLLMTGCAAGAFIGRGRHPSGTTASLAKP